MIRKITLMASLCLPVAAVQAQITLNQSSYASWSAGTDSVRELLANTGAPTANASWDVSGNTYGMSSAVTYVAGTSTAFSNATFYNNETIPVTSAITLSGKRYHGITASGIQTFGVNLARQPFSIGGATGTPTDSIVFDAQNIVNTSAHTQLSFPATMGSNWSSNYSATTTFKLTVALYSIANVPGYIKKTFQVQDTVKGWGKLKVKTLAGSASGFMDVLAVKVHTREVDSFYLAGLPMDPSFLSAVGISQGAVTDEYSIHYYRAGEVTPLMVVSYGDAGYTQESNAKAHMQRLAQNNVSVSNLSLADDMILVYPNPVTDRNIHIAMSYAKDHKWTYVLTDMMGRVAYRGELFPVDSEAEVKVGADKPAGLYNINIYRDGNSALQQTLLIQ